MIQLGTVLKISIGFMNQVNQALKQTGLTRSAYASKFGTTTTFGLALQSNWFTLSLVVCVVVMVLSIFVIWYRDWMGTASFIYQLLMLPVHRLTLFWAKAMTIFISVIGLVAYQWILFFIEIPVFKLIIPKEFGHPEGMTYLMGDNHYFTFIMPTHFTDFIFIYLMGLLAVIILFTAILFERSYRLKGIFYGIAYTGLAVIIFFIPVLIEMVMQVNYLYPVEMMVAEIVLGLVVAIGSISLSHFLLKRKIMV